MSKFSRIHGWLIAAGLAAMISAPDARAAIASAPVDLPALRPVTSCAGLLRADVSRAVGAPTRISGAAVVSGSEAEPYCDVRGVIQPEIDFEVRLPTQGWTQRFLQTGCGGLCGNLRIHVDHAADCTPVTNGQIALASTDMGHEGMGGEWAAENPQSKVDFAYRGVHLTALAA